METISYSYKYASSSHNRTVKIEYKASGPNNDVFYYFVVPDALYTAQDPTASNAQGLRCTFKNYYDYTSSYATNSDRNTLKFRGTESAGNSVYTTGNQYYAKVKPNEIDSGSSQAPIGDYFMFNETAFSSNHTKRCYWGSDILYVATTTKTSDYMRTAPESNKDDLLQVQYSVSGNNTFYSYLFAVDDGSIKGDHPSAYVSVVPNNRQYNQYKLMDVKYSSPTNHKYSTAPQSITNGSNETVSASSGGGSDKTIYRNHLNNQNYTVLDHMYIRIYVDIEKDLGLLSAKSPKIYLWNGSHNNGWSGQEMNGGTLDTSTNPDVYRYYFDFNVPEYTKFQIVNYYDDSKKSQAFNGTLSPADNHNIYRITNANNWYPDYVGNGAGWGWDVDKTQCCAVDGPNATSLPHYATRS